jgi:hypothetical protein
MTVSSTASTQSFAGTQSSLTFTFPAIYGHPEEIAVIQELISNPATYSTLVYGSAYTVTINTNGIGGVVHVLPTFSAAYLQKVQRNTTMTQESDYEDYSQFPAETLEENLDRLTLICQDLSRRISALE